MFLIVMEECSISIILQLGFAQRSSYSCLRNGVLCGGFPGPDSSGNPQGTFPATQRKATHRGTPGPGSSGPVAGFPKPVSSGLPGRSTAKQSNAKQCKAMQCEKQVCDSTFCIVETGKSSCRELLILGAYFSCAGASCDYAQSVPICTPRGMNSDILQREICTLPSSPMRRA